MNSIKNISPFLQAAVSVGLGLLFMLGSLMFKETFALQQEKPWVLAITFLLFYSVSNVVFSLGADNAEKYWTQSIIGYIGTMVVLGLLAYLVSGLDKNLALSFKWLFIVVTISYLVFMSIVRAIKGIVEYAEKEEWNQPNLRDKRKK